MDQGVNVAALADDQLDSLDLDALSDAELGALEVRIASRYMKIFPWGAVLWGLGNVLCWLAL